MKKLIASFTVIVYLAFACGVMVSYHYCMGQFDSYRLYKPASDWCATCSMHTDGKGCCHDEVKIIKLQDDHQTSSISFSSENAQPAVIAYSEFLSVALFNKGLLVNKTDHSPPLLSEQDVYLQNRVFRI
jgi:hypothetical protein